MKTLKKIFNWIWSNVQEVEPEPTAEWVSYEVYEDKYDKFHDSTKEGQMV